MACTNVDISDSEFKRAKIVESIFMKVNLLNCKFNSFAATALTMAQCQYDKKYDNLFKNDISSLSPSTFEWEEREEDNAQWKRNYNIHI